MAPRLIAIGFVAGEGFRRSCGLVEQTPEAVDIDGISTPLPLRAA
jgi:hypothetical protein